MQRVFLFLMILTISGGAKAQSITNVRARQEDKKIIVTYDLTGGDQGSRYTVHLFVSEDGGNNWKGPMTAVAGDAGTGVNPGTYKQLTWDVLSEPGREQLTGNKIAFKIQAIFYPGQSASGTASGTPCPGLPTITDPRDGQVYPTVQIGSQCWLQKNMNYQIDSSWCYENKSENCDFYGRLYDWETALKVCPKGWHLPSDEEWSTLITFLGGVDIAAGKMKEAGPSHWASPNEGATNSSGFTALPGGFRTGLFGFSYLTGGANFWSSTEYSSTYAWYRNLYYNSEAVYRNNTGYFKMDGFSCRCLKDN